MNIIVVHLTRNIWQMLVCKILFNSYKLEYMMYDIYFIKYFAELIAFIFIHFAFRNYRFRESIATVFRYPLARPGIHLCRIESPSIRLENQNRRFGSIISRF